MKNYPPATLILGATLSAALLLSGAPVAHAQAAQEPTAPAPKTEAPVAPKAAQDIFEAMLGAIEDDNRAVFVAQADANFKAALTPPVFKAVSDQVAARLKAGHQDLYLGEMKKAGFTVHLWRVRFTDGGDDFLAQMSLKDGKVGGFFLT